MDSLTAKQDEEIAKQHIPVLCVPKAGKSAEIVAQWLTDLGAAQVRFLAGNFISAVIERGQVSVLSKVAEVQEKKTSRPLLATS